MFGEGSIAQACVGCQVLAREGLSKHPWVRTPDSRSRRQTLVSKPFAFANVRCPAVERSREGSRHPETKINCAALVLRHPTPQPHEMLEQGWAWAASNRLVWARMRMQLVGQHDGRDLHHFFTQNVGFFVCWQQPPGSRTYLVVVDDDRPLEQIQSGNMYVSDQQPLTTHTPIEIMVQRKVLLLLALAAVGLEAATASGSTSSSVTSTGAAAAAAVPHRRLHKPTTKARLGGGTVPARATGVSSVRGGAKAAVAAERRTSIWLPILAAYLYNLSIGFTIPVLPKVSQEGRPDGWLVDTMDGLLEVGSSIYRFVRTLSPASTHPLDAPRHTHAHTHRS